MNNCHSFNIEDAEKYGVEAAVLLFNLRFWLAKNKANKRNIHDGYVWTYNSSKAFAELFPYMNEKKIYRVLKKLGDCGAILTGNYNKAKYDRTKWYSLPEFKTDDQDEEIHLPNMENGNSKSVRPIPIYKPDNKPDKNNIDVIKNDEYFSIKDLSNKYPRCTEAMEVIRQLKLEGHHIYDGGMRLSVWDDCEDAMNSVDFDCDYIVWWMEEKAKHIRKIPSLDNMLASGDMTTFAEMYEVYIKNN